MVYIEAQDKKLKFGIKTNELQASWFDWYSIDASDFRLIENRISAKSANVKRPLLICLKPKSRAVFFQYLKDIIS